jgi:hypothetical protein
MTIRLNIKRIRGDYLGAGIEYAAYKIGNKVVKVPLSYFQRITNIGNFNRPKVLRQIAANTNLRLHESDINNTELMRLGIYALPPKRSPEFKTALFRGKQSAQKAKRFLEFGIPTQVNRYGFQIQPFVRGTSYKDEGMTHTQVESIMRQRLGFNPEDIHTENVFFTPTGLVQVDYGEEHLVGTRKPTIEEIVEREHRKALSRAVRRIQQ